MKASLLVFILVALSMTASCIVKITTPYYRPSAATGEQVRANKREPRTDSVILFKHQDVTVGVNTLYRSIQQGHPTNSLYLDISFEIPEGKVVQLVDHYVVVSAPSVKSWKSELSGMIWTGPGRTGEIPTDAQMIGKNNAWRLGTAQGYGNTKNAAFFFSASLYQGSELETLEIKLPKFIINDFEVNLSKITLTLNKEDIWTSLP